MALSRNALIDLLPIVVAHNILTTFKKEDRLKDSYTKRQVEKLRDKLEFFLFPFLKQDNKRIFSLIDTLTNSVLAVEGLYNVTNVGTSCNILTLCIDNIKFQQVKKFLNSIKITAQNLALKVSYEDDLAFYKDNDLKLAKIYLSKIWELKH